MAEGVCATDVLVHSEEKKGPKRQCPRFRGHCYEREGRLIGFEHLKMALPHQGVPTQSSPSQGGKQGGSFPFFVVFCRQKCSLNVA